LTGLHDLAREAGLQIDWEDAAGRPQRVSDENLVRILSALGYSAQDEDEIGESLRACRVDRQRRSFVSARRSEGFALPQGSGAPGAAELELEDGTVRSVRIEETRGALHAPPVAEIGYHTLRGADWRLRLAIAPERCLSIGDLTPGRRLWGPAVQIPSLRDDKEGSFGDFGALRDTVRQFTRGSSAGALAISPTHALFPADPTRFSPYAPSSRLFLNILFADPGLIGQPLPAQHSDELIDWESAIPARIEALRAAHAACGVDVRSRVQEYSDRMGPELERHAAYDALHVHFFGSGAHGWQDWPAQYQDSGSEAVARFAAEHREEVDFFLFAQWLAAESLDAAQKEARAGGMPIGLIADLAVGMDGGGSHAWSRPGDLLNGLSVGAPPDLLGPDGQDWGLTTFSPAALQRTGFEPFIATLRAALDHAGGIRIDHALGLNRLWVVPHGGTPADGAYLTYPLDDMLRILAIESHRANAVVIGEDLGTVPEGLRPELEQNHVLGMRVLWFERDAEGGYTPPAQWQEQAVAMTGTHDLPTITGWWQGRDIDWTWALGRSSPHADETEARAARGRERTDLWDALVASGAAAGPQPDIDKPAPVVEAILRHVGRTPCELAIIPLEDILGSVEQPNLPGTTDQHPNWRRRMPASTSDLLARPEVARRLADLDASRS
jgi:4-alpha-glucanotransferase